MSKEMTVDGKTLQQVTMDKFTEGARMLDSFETPVSADSQKALTDEHFRKFEELRIIRDFLQAQMNGLLKHIQGYAASIAPSYFENVQEVQVFLDKRTIQKVK